VYVPSGFGQVGRYLPRTCKWTPDHQAGFLACKAKEEATALMEKVHARIPSNMISESILAEVSPVIGTHTGPGTIGIAYMLGM